MGSAGFLLVFAAVNGANAALAEETDSSRLLPVLGVVLCLAALGCLIWQTATTSPGKLWFLWAMAGGAFAIEVSFRILTGRRMNLQRQRKGPR